MKKNEMHISFPAISENESLSRVLVAALATQLNPTIEELSDIRTAVSEAVTNAIIHGYNNSSGIVYIDAYIQGKLFTVTVRDEGKGIADIDMCMQPFFTSAVGCERSGMGFSVMEAFMDSLVVESVPDKGTAVTMTKLLGVSLCNDE